MTMLLQPGDSARSFCVHCENYDFFTVEAARNSNGLGLSIAKTLVEQMGGFILAELENKKLNIRIQFK